MHMQKYHLFSFENNYSVVVDFEWHDSYVLVSNRILAFTDVRPMNAPQFVLNGLMEPAFPSAIINYTRNLERSYSGETKK